MRAEKEAIVSEIQSSVDGAEYVFLTDYRGLSVEKMAALRDELRRAGACVMVVRNAFLGRAMDVLGWGGMESFLEGPTAIISGKGDLSEAAKILKTFGRANNLPPAKGGRLGEKVLSAEDVGMIAALPSRGVLLSVFVGTVCAPMTQLAMVLQQKVLSLLYALKAIEKKKSEV